MASLNKRFRFFITIIVLFAGWMRFYNINFASLWSDELYSVLSVHPDNSWYEILYLQRGHQPPAYFVLLWVWTKVFTYNEFSVKLLSVLGGVTAIIVSALLGKKIKDERLGIIMALLVAFNPTQIIYSLEVRFYIFAYVFAALSLWVYWHIITKKPSSYFIYFLKACIDACLWYFHHFGLLVIFAEFVFDLYLFWKERDQKIFFRKLAAYALTGLIYLPWFFWGFVEGLSMKSYWLKEIDIVNYLSFNLGYPWFINIIGGVFILYYLYKVTKLRNTNLYIFPLVVFCVTSIPVAYSYLRMPVLVDRYGIVMAPAMYVMAGIALLYVWDALVTKKKAVQFFFTGLLLTIFIAPGIWLSFIDKTKLEKQPWREMGAWFKQQQDIDSVPIYNMGRYVKQQMNINFYIGKEKRVWQIAELRVGADKKMYLLETNSVWQIPDSVMKKVNASYYVEKVEFNRQSFQWGRIYICSQKEMFPKNTKSTQAAITE